ncbi:MAG: terminase, partial [Mycoplasmataceae bacterium]|nr:terminase [Mycoplasmataceae bacterium]
MGTSYLGNPKLKSANVPVEFSEEQLTEYIKCHNDPVYFITKYVKIIHVDHGLVDFNLYPFQENMVRTFHDNRFVICKMPRQSGKSTTIIAFFLHYILFNENVQVGILANKGSLARELLDRLKLSYENMPIWLQQGILAWNKGNIELENGSKVLAAATSSSAVRGSSFNIIFLDEFAHVPKELAEEFFTSVYPTISSGQTTKVFIVSTPLGLNQFYKMWVDSEEKRSNYIPIEVHWSEIPGRDQKWKEETIRNTSERQFSQEFETEFIGSTRTLISGSKLRSMPFKTPVHSYENLDIFEQPESKHTYTIVVDTAKGLQLDYSAFTVIDSTALPYKVVAKYRDNEISPMLYPNFIHKAAKHYNNAFVLVEVNDIGQQVVEILHQEIEY